MRSRCVLRGLLVLLACTFTLPPDADAQTPKRGGTLRVSYGNEIAHLDFHTAPGYEMMWVAMNVGCGPPTHGRCRPTACSTRSS
jgi:hypothetical protein